MTDPAQHAMLRELPAQTAAMKVLPAADSTAAPKPYARFRQTLKSPSCTGVHVLSTVVMHSYPALIRPAPSAQASGPAGKSEYTLQGKAYCGMCGAHMVGVRREDAYGEYRIYVCDTRERSHACKKCSEKKDLIELLVADQILERLLTPARTELIAEAVDAVYRLRFEDAAASARSRRTAHGEIDDWVRLLGKRSLRDADFRARLIELFLDCVYFYDDHMVVICHRAQDASNGSAFPPRFTQHAAQEPLRLAA